MPTRDRGASAVAIRLGRDLVLLDCGEGTQRQMVLAGLSFHRVTAILVTHLHGDHVLGLPGLLQTMSLLGRETPLTVVGPRGLYAYLQAVSENVGGPTFEVTVKEIASPGAVFEGCEVSVVAAPAKHRVEAWSYAVVEHPKPGKFHPDKAKALGVPRGSLWKELQEGRAVEIDGHAVTSGEVVDPPQKGRRVVYSGDTTPNDQLRDLAEGADLLIHESTFLDELSERAATDGHTTARQAAALAASAGVKHLILTHLSSRYSDPAPVLTEARVYFPNTEVASDLLKVEIPRD